MEDLLYLAHRIPYPPNKGDKIRSWHILKHLAERWRVHLGCFVDYAEDWEHTGFLDGICASTCFVPLPKLKARARSLTGLLRGEALSVACYRDASMRDWVRATVERVARLVRISEHKRRQMPPTLIVTGKAFAIGRRHPIAQGFPG